MCQAFNGVITKSKKVYWEVGMDSHEDVLTKFKSQDPEWKDDKEPPNNTFARFEIVPKNGNYLYSNQQWKFKLDESIKPFWWEKDYEKPCRVALKDWKKQVYNFNLKEAQNPINPFKIKSPKITKEVLKLLYIWASVGASVGNSAWASVRDSVGALVRDSVWASVGASVGNSVRASAGDSVWNSVGNSVGAYIGLLFPNIKDWKYTKKLKVNGYPFQSAVDLWKMGLVSSFDGKKWRLHSGKKAEILWEGTIKQLQKAIIQKINK